MYRGWGKLFIAVALLVGTAAPPAHATTEGGSYGVGVRPTTLHMPTALRGGETAREFGIINGADVERTFRVTPAGELAPWVRIVDPATPSLTSLRTVDVQALDTRTLLLIVDVPPDAANGRYAGSVRVTAAPSETDEGLAVGLGAELLMAAEVVGEQVVAATVTGLDVRDTEAGLPLRMRMRLQNDGNVLVNPAVSYVIRQDGREVGRVEHGTARAAPGRLTELETSWETEGRSPGTYEVAATVELPGLTLTPDPVQVVLHPRGTLSRSGTVGELRLDTEPVLGRATRVRALFTNTGRIEATPVLTVEIRRDGVLVGDESSDAVRVDPGADRDLGVLIPSDEVGEYRLDGHVTFDGYQSEPLSLTYTVSSPGLPPTLLYAATGAVALSALVLLSYLWRSRRRGQGPPADVVLEREPVGVG